MRQPPIDKPSDDLYRHVSKLDLIVWSSDLHRRFSDVSGGAERILGYPAQQWISDPNFWFDRLHPEDREWVLREFQDAINPGKSFKLEYRMRAADGQYVWLNEIAHTSDFSEPDRAQMFGVMLDITERKIGEEAFGEQQRRYEQMAENIQELFWMTALPTHEAIYVSPAFQTITGYSPEALLRSPLSYRDMIHPEDRDRILSRSETAQRTGKFDEEFRIVRADGAVRWVSARGFPVRDSKGNIYRFAGVLQDITARRATELALRESEDRYRDLVEHSHDLLCTHDLQGKLLSCNPAPARLLGYSVEELLQIPMMQLIAPEARALFPEYLQRIQREGSAEGLMVLLTRSGQRRFWQYKNTLRSEGVPEPVVRGMAQDVTERLRAEKALRLSEERFRVAVKNARVMVSTQNRSLRYTWISNPILAWAEQDCIDKLDDDLLHPEDAYRVKVIKQWALDTGSGSRTGLQIAHQGRNYYLDVTVEPIFDPAGAVVGVTSAATDITELHDKADRLQLLLEINSALISKLDFPDLLHALSSCIHRLFKQEFLSMSVCHPSQSQITSYPLDAPSLGRSMKLEVEVATEKSLAAQALKSGEIELFGTSTLSSQHSEFVSRTGGVPLRSVACIPIETPRGRLATLNLGSTRENAFSSADFYLMRQLGAIVSTAMTNADAFSELRRFQHRLKEEKKYLEEEIGSIRVNEVIGRTPVFEEVWVRVEAVASAEANVILYGEPGVGKELLARAIHRRSPRGENMFVRFNCAAVPEESLDRALFGLESDPYVAEASPKIGRVELANHSTLFLENVSELPTSLQQKVLRLLEEREIERIGGHETIPVNVRIIASSTKNLEELVELGIFRSDLYQELNTFPIHVPPLRERRDDIPLLVDYFVQKYARRLQREVPSIPEETLEALLRWHWKGNVRELENFVERSLILTKGPELEAPLWELRWSEAQPLTDVLAKAEREHIVRTLRDTEGTIAGPHGAAARLGLKPDALRTKIQRLGIPTPGTDEGLPS